MAAKYEYMSRSIKTGSFIRCNFSNVEAELVINKENDKCSTSVNIRQKINSNLDRSFVCDTCHKGFTQKYNLKKHQRIHTGEKAFKCETCSKSFTQKGQLKSHQIVHTGAKPYEWKHVRSDLINWQI